jgi:hypothetical protein
MEKQKKTISLNQVLLERKRERPNKNKTLIEEGDTWIDDYTKKNYKRKFQKNKKQFAIDLIKLKNKFDLEELIEDPKLVNENLEFLSSESIPSI